MTRILQLVSSLQPGQRVEVDTWELSCLPSFEFGDSSIEGKCDQVLERVVGSGYGWYYYVDPINSHTVLFGRSDRQLNPSERTYVSPDRRHFYEKINHSLWRLRSQESDKQ